MRVLWQSMAVAIVVLVSPSAASAYYAGVENGTLRYEGDPGEFNLVYLVPSPEGVTFDAAAFQNERVGPGCRIEHRPGRSQAVCDTQGVAAIDVALGDVDDNLSVASVQLPVTYSGGDGRDQVHYYSYDPPGGVAVAIDNDGVADDGPASRDNVMEDVEWLWGSSLNDTIGSGGNGASIWLGGGDDTGRGGGGDDVITSVSWSAGFNGPKLTWELSADGRDTVACGAGNDAVVGDGRDRVARDCEIVGREIPGARTGPRYEFLATARDDKVALARIVDAQWTSTLVRAGAGNDRIDARDTNRGAGVNAVIRCGSGRDKVYADAGDRVSRDCERVLR